MTDEMDRTVRLLEAFAEQLDFFRQRRRQDKGVWIVAVTGNIRCDHLVVASELFGECGPLPARTKRAVQGYHAAFGACCGGGLHCDFFWMILGLCFVVLKTPP